MARARKTYRIRWGTALVALAALSPVPPSRADDDDAAKTIRLEVDATEVSRRLIHSRLVIPAEPGPLVLLYPKWIPGEHGPTGPVTDLAGLKMTAGGSPVRWERDEVEMTAFRIEVPRGANEVEVTLDFLAAPPATHGFSSASSSSDHLAVLNWNQLLLYPKGRAAREIRYRAGLRLPKGWSLATALPIAARDDARADFKPVDLTTLIDSPVLCGRHLRERAIGPRGGPDHYLAVACDSEEGLALTPEVEGQYGRLVAETGALFGAHPFRSYRFLVALSDQVTHFGLEHHESSDNRGGERSLVDDDARALFASLLPHEFVHAWNGKYRRPADMTTGGYQEPQKTRLLWIYEGLTNYLGVVLAARSGLWTDAQFRDHLAIVASGLDAQRGRSWRPLADTTVAAQLLYNARRDWAAWRRGVDFYNEGTLLWLEADVLIRERTGGRKSLDDFCRAFHGGQDGSPAVKTYTLDDVVEALNSVAPFDWKEHLTERVERTSERPPLEGVRRSGWRLAYGEEPSALQKIVEGELRGLDLMASIGLVLRRDGTVVDLASGRAADRAGIGPGMTLIGVNSRRFSPEVLRAAIRATKRAGKPLELLLENGDAFRSCTLDYRDGERYPRLEREKDGADLLAQIVRPRTPVPARGDQPDSK